MSGEEAVRWLREQVTQRLEAAQTAGSVAGSEWTWDRDSRDGYLRTPDGTIMADALNPEDEEFRSHAALNDPQDVIARCEAELAILDEHRAGTDGWCRVCDYDEAGLTPNHGRFPCRTMWILANGYRHRPGYAERWG